jgi:hypothetical protein
VIERDERDHADDGSGERGTEPRPVPPGHPAAASSRLVKAHGMSADGLVITMCAHGLDTAWCYLCHVDGYGVDPQVLWGLALDDDLEAMSERRDPMSEDLAGYLRFFCDEFNFGFDETFSTGEAATVIWGFLVDAPTERQRLTIEALDGGAHVDRMTYAEARTKIRRAIALRGLRSA